MVEAIKETLRFWFKEIIPEAVRNAFNWLQIWGILMELAVSFVAVSIYFWSVEQKNIPEELGKIALITLCIWGVLLLLTILAYVFREPAKIHDEQKKTIDYYQDRKLKIKLYDHEISFRKLDSKIRVPEFEILGKSTEGKKIVELEVRIEFITQYVLDNKNNLVPGGAVRDGNVIEGAEQVELRPDIPLPLKLATFSDDLSYLVFGKYGHNISLLSKESICNIKINFSGKLEGETEFRKTIEEVDLYANSSIRLLTLASIAASVPKESTKINPILFEKFKESRK